MLTKNCIGLFLMLCLALFSCVHTSEIDPIRVQSVVLNKVETSILEGATETLTAVVTPAEAENKTISWSTNNEAVATVSPSGVVSAHKEGVAIITVTTEEGAKTATCTVTVSKTKVAVTGVLLNQATSEIKVGATTTLIPTLVPANATNQNVEWTTSDATVATVVSGVVTGHKEGAATIKVTTQDGRKEATCAVTVSNTVVSVTGVTLNHETASLLVGGTTRLTATVVPANATNKEVTWATSDAAVATVSPDGVVTAVALGTATITVTTQEGSKTASCVVTVTNTVVAVTEVTLDRSTLSLNQGSTATLVATVAPTNATNRNVSWTTSDAAVASVSDAGLVTATAVGTATITVTTQDGAKTATCAVTVQTSSRPINPPGDNDCIVIGGLRWTKGNLVAKNTQECRVGSAIDGGVYFQCGSLIGWNGGALGDGTGITTILGLDRVVWPTAMGARKPTFFWQSVDKADVGTLSNFYFNYSKAPWNSTSSIDIGLFAESVPGEHEASGTLRNGRYANLGVGDPCTYYLGDSWRLPTGAEFVALKTAGASSSMVTYQGAKGFWFGPNPGQENSSIFLPASGYRNRFSGAWDAGNAHGYYWSGSVESAQQTSNLHFLDISTNPVEIISTYRSIGIVVRCVSSVL